MLTSFSFLNSTHFSAFRFWFLFVAVVTAINFFYTLLYMSLALLREKSTRQWLKQAVEDKDKKAVRDFCHQALGPGISSICSISIQIYFLSDGVLTLRFIESHVGGIVVRDVAAKMFNDYTKSV